MKQYNLEKISFKTYLKIMLVSSLGMGLIFGGLSLILSLIDSSSVHMAINGEVITGIKAGLGSLILYPLVMVFLFLFFGVFLWLGFLLIMKFKKKLKVTIEIDSNI